MTFILFCCLYLVAPDPAAIWVLDRDGNLFIASTITLENDEWHLRTLDFGKKTLKSEQVANIGLVPPVSPALGEQWILFRQYRQMATPPEQNSVLLSVNGDTLHGHPIHVTRAEIRWQVADTRRIMDIPRRRVREISIGTTRAADVNPPVPPTGAYKAGQHTMYAPVGGTGGLTPAALAPKFEITFEHGSRLYVRDLDEISGQMMEKVLTIVPFDDKSEFLKNRLGNTEMDDVLYFD